MNRRSDDDTANPETLSVTRRAIFAGFQMRLSWRAGALRRVIAWSGSRWP